MNAQLPAKYHLIPLDMVPKQIRISSSIHENFQYNYVWNDSRTVEINYLQEGNMCEMRPDGLCCFEQGTVHTLVTNRKFKQFSTTPVTHEYYLVATLAEPVIPLTQEQLAAWECTGNAAIIPEYITDPVLCHRIGNRLKNMYEQSGADLLEPLKLKSCWYELLTLLTAYAVDQVRNVSGKGENVISPHTRKACQYINQHLSEPFSVADVSKAAGVTYNHLKNIFVRDMGRTLVEYRNMARIRTVQNLLTVEGVTLEEAGESVGIHDPAYLSRMFRKYTGMSVREYRRLAK